MFWWAVKSQVGKVSAQAGSRFKRWDRDELENCGATGTASPRDLNLQGEIHPVFVNWGNASEDLRRELQQPLLLASRLLEHAGIPWLSDFLIEDLFSENYPGKAPSCSVFFKKSHNTGPRTIVRHHRASWATVEVKRGWVDSTRKQMKTEIARSVRWELDEEMFRERGWNGYTCRHPRQGLPLIELDRYETIAKFDQACGDRKCRNMTILLMAEYPKRLAELRRQGKSQSEEYLLTAFMTTVTILHELGHVLYWKDPRTLARDAKEPFYGADLEMELGNSFVASIFDGWTPVPVRELARLQETFTLSEGLAWRQSLSWDHHRLRPKHRAHYSIPVDYIARLFTHANWTANHTTDLLHTLIQPAATLPDGAHRALGLLTPSHHHASAALPDFHGGPEEWRWAARPGAPFRIPQYDGCLCPEIDLPVALDDVVVEPLPSAPGSVASSSSSSSSSRASSSRPVSQSPRRFLLAPDKARRCEGAAESAGPVTPPVKKTAAAAGGRDGDTGLQTPVKAMATSSSPLLLSGYGSPDRDLDGVPCALRPGFAISPDRPELSVDELKKRLSRLIGVSLTELELLFEAS
ncbi:hypothetical protein F4780DRAFT_161970 [Xylariomycetidae sp. FL0641]|nr:hypothetical protein F4780DRAFT_161970 [Xylariomycetidae sp. FL0641]